MRGNFLTLGVRAAKFTRYAPDPPLPLGMRPGFSFLQPRPAPACVRSPTARIGGSVAALVSQLAAGAVRRPPETMRTQPAQRRQFSAFLNGLLAASAHWCFRSGQARVCPSEVRCFQLKRFRRLSYLPINARISSGWQRRSTLSGHSGLRELGPTGLNVDKRPASAQVCRKDVSVSNSRQGLAGHFHVGLMVQLRANDGVASGPKFSGAGTPECGIQGAHPRQRHGPEVVWSCKPHQCSYSDTKSLFLCQLRVTPDAQARTHENVSDGMVAHAPEHRLTQMEVTDIDSGMVPLGVLRVVPQSLLSIHDCMLRAVRLDCGEQEEVSRQPELEVRNETKLANVSGKCRRNRSWIRRRGGVPRIKQPLRHRPAWRTQCARFRPRSVRLPHLP